MKVRVRRAREGEKQEVHRIESAVLYQHLKPAEINRWYEGLGKWQYYYFVTTEGKKIVGAAIVEIYDMTEDGSVVLDYVAFVVRADRQRQGIGKVLFVESLAAMRKKFNVIALHVETNTADAFWRKTLMALSPADFQEMTVNARGHALTFFAVAL